MKLHIDNDYLELKDLGEDRHNSIAGYADIHIGQIIGKDVYEQRRGKVLFAPGHALSYQTPTGGRPIYFTKGDQLIDDRYLKIKDLGEDRANNVKGYANVHYGKILTNPEGLNLSSQTVLFDASSALRYIDHAGQCPIDFIKVTNLIATVHEPKEP